MGQSESRKALKILPRKKTKTIKNIKNRRKRKMKNPAEAEAETILAGLSSSWERQQDWSDDSCDEESTIAITDIKEEEEPQPDSDDDNDSVLLLSTPTNKKDYQTNGLIIDLTMEQEEDFKDESHEVKGSTVIVNKPASSERTSILSRSSKSRAGKRQTEKINKAPTKKGTRRRKSKKVWEEVTVHSESSTASLFEAVNTKRPHKVTDETKYPARMVLYPQSDPRNDRPDAILRCFVCGGDAALFINEDLLHKHLAQKHKLDLSK